MMKNLAFFSLAAVVAFTLAFILCVALGLAISMTQNAYAQSPTPTPTIESTPTPEANCETYAMKSETRVTAKLSDYYGPRLPGKRCRVRQF